MTELYKTYRPRKLSQVYGQKDAVAILTKKIERKELPHALILCGPSGCGKTTIARILRRPLECDKAEFRELNCADTRGLDTIREIRSRMNLAPLRGKSKIYLLDEVHMLTKESQNALLKMLEDTPKHVYFQLCTTEPQKLIKTIHTRSTIVQVKSLSDGELEKLLDYVCTQEKIHISEEVLARIVQFSDGSARQALVLLDQVYRLDGEEAQLSAVESTTTEREGKELVKALIDPKVRWPEIANILKKTTEEPEKVRRAVLGYATAVMLNGGKLAARCVLILATFRDHFYDCGKAGLVLACHEVVSQR